jgi:hypothetical protein
MALSRIAIALLVYCWRMIFSENRCTLFRIMRCGPVALAERTGHDRRKTKKARG